MGGTSGVLAPDGPQDGARDGLREFCADGAAEGAADGAAVAGAVRGAVGLRGRCVREETDRWRRRLPRQGVGAPLLAPEAIARA